MTLPFDKKYPPQLTNGLWQKHKSLTDKIFSSTKTGIGDQLKKIESSWNAIDFELLEIDRLFLAGKTSADELHDGLKAAEKLTSGSLKKLAQDLKLLSSSAAKAAENKSLSKEAKTAVANISVESNKLANKINSYSTDEIKKKISRQIEQQEETIKSFIAAYKTLDAEFRTFASHPQAETFSDLVKKLSGILGKMQPATGALSRQPGPDQKKWADASASIRLIESSIPPVVIALKDKDINKAKPLMVNFIKVGLAQNAVFKTAAS